MVNGTTRISVRPRHWIGPVLLTSALALASLTACSSSSSKGASSSASG